MPRFLLIIFISALLLASCGMKKDMEEMHDATIAVKENSDEMYSDLRQGDSAAGRRAAWEALLKTSTPQDKLVYAAQFVRSFEVQMWSGIGDDTSVIRMQMAQKNAEEFMLMVQSLIKPRQTEAIPFADKILNPIWGNRMKSFNAISVALQEMDPKQDRFGRKTERLTFLSMLQTALRASFERRLGQSIEKYPAYVTEILKHERVAVLMMETRLNYSVVLALGKVSDICNGGIDFVKMRFFGWKLDMSKAGISEINLGIEKLQSAEDTFEFMRSVGIVPKMNDPLVKVMSGMKVSDRLRAFYPHYKKLRDQERSGVALTEGQRNSRSFVEVDFVREFVEFRKLTGIPQSF